jgi:hypothetical protein
LELFTSRHRAPEQICLVGQPESGSLVVAFATQENDDN